MKKLEALLNKVECMQPYEIVGGLATLVVMVLFEGIFILIAEISNCYFPLSIMTFLWVWMIVECVVEKIFFKKLNNYLMETPKATTLIFWIIFIAILILSLKYFVGFILTVILAFMLADYKKNKKNKENN